MDRFRRPSPMSKAIAHSPQSGTVTAPVPSPPANPGMPGQVGVIPGLIEDPRTMTGAEITPPPGALDEARFNAPPPPPLRAKVPRIALLLPLSGPHAKLGNSLLNAAQLALFHFAGKNFELLPQDTQGTPEGAADAAALAIGDGASLILGPLFSSSVETVAPPARAAGVKVVTFSNDRRVAGDGGFTLGFLPDEQVEHVVRFAFKRGMRRFAVLAPNNSYGASISAALEAAALDLGAEITGAEFYDPLADDFSGAVKTIANYKERRQNLLDQRKELENRQDEIALQALKRLENLQTLGDLPFDALLVAEGGKRLQALAALLPYYDIDPKKTRILGTGQWDADGIGSEPALVGGWFAAPAKKERQNFIQQYTEMYATAPSRLATLAYDATALAAVFVKSDGRFDVSEITAPQGFAGRDGIFRFHPEGYAERGLSIHQVGERNTRIILNAPASFQAAN